MVGERETEDKEEVEDLLGEEVRRRVSSEEVRGNTNRMMEEIRRKAEKELEDNSIEGVSMSLLLRARSRLKTLRAAGPDRIPVEI
eukprot:7147568-Pyramimonas_sp.AAC.1